MFAKLNNIDNSTCLPDMHTLAKFDAQYRTYIYNDCNTQRGQAVILFATGLLMLIFCIIYMTKTTQADKIILLNVRSISHFYIRRFIFHNSKLYPVLITGLDRKLSSNPGNICSVIFLREYGIEYIPNVYQNWYSYLTSMIWTKMCVEPLVECYVVCNWYHLW